MIFLEYLIEFLFEYILAFFYMVFKKIGSFIRWTFLNNKYSYAEIYKQNWNTLVGFLAITFLVISIVLFNQKFNEIKENNPKTSQNIKDNTFQDGDIIFHTSTSSQSKAIQYATNSKYSHCGIIFYKGKVAYVLEAVQPVKFTPLNKWIARGKEKKYVVKRLFNAEKILTKEVISKMKNIGEKMLGKDYDLTFEWSDDKIYCSELIWKIYKNSTGIEIGKLQKLKEFNLNDPSVKSKMKERYGTKIPMDEIVISPAAIFESKLLKSVNY